MMGLAFKLKQQGKLSSGATLVELIVTIVIISIALVSLAMTVSFSARHSADSMIQIKLVELGQSYAEEILSKRFDENTPSGGIPACSLVGIICGGLGPDGEDRANYDDIDDYHGLNESPPKDALGLDRPGYSAYRVEIDVAYMSAAQILAYNLDESIDAKLISINIYPPSGSAINFTVYKGNF